jgi:hypothetical protein
VVDHIDVIVQFYLPILHRIFESRIEGTFKLVGKVLGSLDEEGSRDVQEMKIYGCLVANVFQLDFWECLHGADVGDLAVEFEKDREAWGVFCDTFVCREIEEEEYTIECRRICGSFCEKVIGVVHTLAGDISTQKEFVKRLVGYAVETLDPSCLRICASVVSECKDDWCLDRLNALAVSLWYVCHAWFICRTPSLDVFDDSKISDINLDVVNLVLTLTEEKRDALLSSKVGINRLETLFLHVFESSGETNTIFTAMNNLYGSSSGVVYTQWALRSLWWIHLSEVRRTCLDDIEVLRIMVEAVTKLQFEDPGKLIHASIDAHAWCMTLLNNYLDDSTIIDPVAFFTSICKKWLDPARLAGLGHEDVATSRLVYNMVAITSISASNATVLSIIPSLVYSFPILIESYISIVFGLITRTVLESIVLQYPKTGKYCGLNAILTNPSTEQDESGPLTGRKSQWDAATSCLWEKAVSYCLIDALDLIIGLVQTNQADRYLINHCNTLLLDLLISSTGRGEDTIANRCLGIFSQPVFANILFTNGKRRPARKQAYLDVIEGCIREEVSCKRWACQLLSVGVGKGDVECIALAERVRDVLVKRDCGDLISKVFAIKCMPYDESVSVEKEWLVMLAKEKKDRGFSEFVMH